MCNLKIRDSALDNYAGFIEETKLCMFKREKHKLFNVTFFSFVFVIFMGVPRHFIFDQNDQNIAFQSVDQSFMMHHPWLNHVFLDVIESSTEK